MNDVKQLPDLEAALLDRAERLAAEYIDHGRDGREAILRDERDRLRKSEERISQEAAAIADRLYRRRVQAAELRLHGMLDQQRWQLIQDVAESLPKRLQEFADLEDGYEALLTALLGRAADSIAGQDLVASFSARDLDRLRDHWSDFCERAAPGRNIALDPEPLSSSGGVRVASRDNRVCVDATFEGRIERFEDELLQTIAERLFARELTKGELLHG